jgi:hypothetical protein
MTGAFLPTTTPPDEFTGMHSAVGFTNTVIVTALAVGTWGDTFAGGEFSDNSITVDLTNVCPQPPGNGRFTGGGKLVVSNTLTVTKGFEVECDLDPAHENLELNWTGGNHFHMDTITSANCTKPGIPNPPTAMVNKIVATGTGSYNGVEGYTVEFTLIDNGEPGTFDAAGFVVCQTANPLSCAGSTNVVLNIPVQTVTTGNIQAHLDQGH